MDNKNLFGDNLGLAKIAAIHWSNKTALEFDDCHQLCLFGLYKASKTFKDGKGAKFETWATTHMNNAVKDELRKLKRRVSETLMQNSSEEVEDSFQKGMEEFGDFDPNIERIEESAEFSKVAKYIKEILTQREWEILWLIAVEDVPQDRIAAIYGFQQPHVSRIMKGVKKKIMQSTTLCNYAQSLGVI